MMISCLMWRRMRLIEPDESLLAQLEEDIDDVLPLRSHELAAELSEDPVRLYLREIGQVKLLDSDSEFRLATLSEADRHITTLAQVKTAQGRFTGFLDLSFVAFGNAHLVGTSYRRCRTARS